MKDNRGFSLILCGEFHGINVGGLCKEQEHEYAFCTLLNRREMLFFENRLGVSWLSSFSFFRLRVFRSRQGSTFDSDATLTSSSEPRTSVLSRSTAI